MRSSLVSTTGLDSGGEPQGTREPYLLVRWLLVDDVRPVLSQVKRQDPTLSAGRHLERTSALSPARSRIPAHRVLDVESFPKLSGILDELLQVLRDAVHRPVRGGLVRLHIELPEQAVSAPGFPCVHLGGCSPDLILRSGDLT